MKNTKSTIIRISALGIICICICIKFLIPTTTTTYADASCPQPPTNRDLNTLSQRELDIYGLPRHFMNLASTEWQHIAVNIKHHYCATTPTTIQSSIDLGFQNWSGVIADGDNGYTEVDATWNVPCIVYGSPTGESSTWAGLGGNGNKQLVQAGSNSNLSHFLWFPIRTYNAWVENLADPNNPYERIVFPVHCGDEMRVFISQGNYMYIVDLTSGASSIQQFGPTANSSTAECILERTTDHNKTQPLPDFKSVHFSHCHVTTSTGRVLPINHAQYDYSVMRGDDGNTPLVSLSSPTGDGAFSVNWLRSNS